MDSRGAGRGCSGNTFQMACEASHWAVSIQDLPLFSLTDETEEVSDLFRLDSFPCCLKDLFLQRAIVSLNRSAAGITNQDHDVAQNAASPLFDEGGGSWHTIGLAPGEMRVLTEWKEQLNRTEERVQTLYGVLFEFKEIVPASLDLHIPFGPLNGVT